MDSEYANLFADGEEEKPKQKTPSNEPADEPADEPVVKPDDELNELDDEPVVELAGEASDEPSAVSSAVSSDESSSEDDSDSNPVGSLSNESSGDELKMVPEALPPRREGLRRGAAKKNIEKIREMERDMKIYQFGKVDDILKKSFDDMTWIELAALIIVSKERKLHENDEFKDAVNGAIKGNVMSDFKIYQRTQCGLNEIDALNAQIRNVKFERTMAAKLNNDEEIIKRDKIIEKLTTDLKKLNQNLEKCTKAWRDLEEQEKEQYNVKSKFWNENHLFPDDAETFDRLLRAFFSIDDIAILYESLLSKTFQKSTKSVDWLWNTLNDKKGLKAALDVELQNQVGKCVNKIAKLCAKETVDENNELGYDLAFIYATKLFTAKTMEFLKPLINCNLENEQDKEIVYAFFITFFNTETLSPRYVIKQLNNTDLKSIFITISENRGLKADEIKVEILDKNKSIFEKLEEYEQNDMESWNTRTCKQPADQGQCPEGYKMPPFKSKDKDECCFTVSEEVFKKYLLDLKAIKEEMKRKDISADDFDNLKKQSKSLEKDIKAALDITELQKAEKNQIAAVENKKKKLEKDQQKALEALKKAQEKWNPRKCKQSPDEEGNCPDGYKMPPYRSKDKEECCFTVTEEVFKQYLKELEDVKKELKSDTISDQQRKDFKSIVTRLEKQIKAALDIEVLQKQKKALIKTDKSKKPEKFDEEPDSKKEPEEKPGELEKKLEEESKKESEEPEKVPEAPTKKKKPTRIQTMKQRVQDDDGSSQEQDVPQEVFDSKECGTNMWKKYFSILNESEQIKAKTFMGTWWEPLAARYQDCKKIEIRLRILAAASGIIQLS